MRLLPQYLVILFLATLSCTNSEKQEFKKAVVTEEISFDKKGQFKAEPSMINRDSIVFLTGLVKVNEKDATYGECEKWTLTEEQLNEIWSEMKEVDKEYEWYASCSQFPCSYKAKVKIGDKEFELTVNAGGYLWLFTQDAGSHVFILQESSDYFLSVCNPELY